jgi:hypothetical protein
MFRKVLCFWVLFLLLMVVRANADQIYEITGTMTASANSSNSGVAETINYSFMLDYSSPSPAFNIPRFIGTPTISSSGPLGSFSLGLIQIDYVAFVSSGAEIDLIGSFFNNPPTVYTSDFWSCNTQAACATFYPDLLGGEAVGSQLNSATDLWLKVPCSASGVVRQVPEPGTLSLALLGGLAIPLASKKRRKGGIPKSHP